MEPNPKKFPILSHVISRIPHLGSNSTSDSDPSPSHHDIEQPPSPPRTNPNIIAEMPHLNDLNLISSMALAVSDVSQTRSVLQTLGDRPDHETIDHAIFKISEIDSRLGKQLEEIVLSPRPSDVDRLQWRAHLAEKEDELRMAAEKEKKAYKDVVQLDEIHEAYEKLLKDAENRLIKIYDHAASGGSVVVESPEFPTEEVNEDVVCVLQEASMKGIQLVDLSGRHLRILPEAFGRLRALVVFNLSSNQLQAIPDSIAGLERLEEFYLSSNLLESLPDSIGLLHSLKILDVSGNKLTILPNDICNCRSLVELDVSFNCLTYLPTNIGHELTNLNRLSVQLNKIRFLPSSICKMRSLRILDAHFNELRGLTEAIGELTNLEILNLSGNFSDLTELPNSIGDLTSLRELDLSNNQIHALPDTFGRLDNLAKLKIEQNPLGMPPKEVAEEGVEAVKDFMAKRWVDILVEEEEKSKVEMKEDGGREGAGWLSRTTSWLSNVVSENVTGYLGSPRNASPRDPFLDQQL